MDIGTQDRTYTNTGLSADIAEEGEVVTITAKTDIANSKVIMTVNGTTETYPVDLTKSNQFYFVGYGMVAVYYAGAIYGTYDNALKVYSANPRAPSYAEINADGMTLQFAKKSGTEYWSVTTTGTATSGGTLSYTEPTTYMAYPSMTGSYVMLQNTTDDTSIPSALEGAWGVDGSTFIWAGFKDSSIATASLLTAKGNPYDPASIQACLIVGSSQTSIGGVDSVEVIEEVDGAKKFGAISDMQAYVEYTGGVYVAPASVFVPGTGDKTVAALIDLIPLLLMVGLVVGVIGAYRMRGEAQR